MTEFVFLQRGLRDMTSALEGERTKLIVCSLKIPQQQSSPHLGPALQPSPVQMQRFDVINGSPDFSRAVYQIPLFASSCDVTASTAADSSLWSVPLTAKWASIRVK